MFNSHITYDRRLVCVDVNKRHSRLSNIFYTAAINVLIGEELRRNCWSHSTCTASLAIAISQKQRIDGWTTHSPFFHLTHSPFHRGLLRQRIEIGQNARATINVFLTDCLNYTKCAICVIICDSVVICEQPRHRIANIMFRETQEILAMVWHWATCIVCDGQLGG